MPSSSGAQSCTRYKRVAPIANWDGYRPRVTNSIGNDVRIGEVRCRPSDFRIKLAISIYVDSNEAFGPIAKSGIVGIVRRARARLPICRRAMTRANGICGGNGDRRMQKYLVAASTALVIAAFATYAALVTMSNECSSGNALPKFLSQSDPNTSNDNAEKTNPGRQGTGLRAQSKSPAASVELEIINQDKIAGKLYLETWQGTKAAWVHKFVCDIRVGDFVIAIFSVFLAAFAGLLWWAIHQLQNAVRESTRSQKRDSEIIQRAYLSAYPLGIDPLDAAAYAEGHVGIRNVGHLPARKVRWFIDVTTSSDSRRTHFPIGQLSGNNVIHSGSEMKQWGRTAVSRQEFQSFQENNIWLYVWGAIHYDDGFGNDRHTNFCHRYDARGFSPSVSGMSPQQTSQLGRATISAEGAIYHQHGNGGD